MRAEVLREDGPGTAPSSRSPRAMIGISMHQAGQISWSAGRDGDRMRSCQSSAGHRLWHLL